MTTARILIVEDDVAAAQTYKMSLSREGYQTQTAKTIASAKELAAAEQFDAALLDLRLPDGTTLDWLAELKTAQPGAAVIVITGSADIPTAVAAMKLGADNFLTKPVNMEELMVLLAKALEAAHLRRRNDVQRLLHERELGPVFGAGDATRRMVDQAAIAASEDTVVLLDGETGTGKGVLAHWIHDRSARADEPFVELNCSTLKGELLRSELFGHVKGSFTGAAADRPGLIESADRGTLFLDEIGEMDLDVQVQMLKVLEDRTFRRIGENRVRTSDFRLICATNGDVSAAVKQGSFRRDLYYRINVFPIHLPALRERRDDVPALAEQFLRRLGYTHPLSPEVVDRLASFPWEGNIRELRNVLERARLLARGGEIGPEHLPGGSGAQPASPMPDRWNLEEIESEIVMRALEHFGEKTRAAEELGISVSSLYRRLDKLRDSAPAASAS